MHSQRIRLVVAMIFFTLGFSPSSGGQATPVFTDPQDGNSASDPSGSMKIGFFLEKEFQPYFSGCTGGTLMKKRRTVVSSVPTPVLNALGQTVWAWASRPKNYTVARAFAIVTSTQELPDAEPGDLLGMDVLQDPASMLPVGTSKIIYSSNCTAILSDALDADAGISFPIAKLSSVVKADYQSTDTGEIGLIIGVFNNPFLQLYGGSQGPTAAAFAHLLLWDWYRNKFAMAASVPSDKYYVLEWFNGISLYKVTKESRQTNGSINLNASASYLGLASVSNNLAAQYQSYGATRVENYKFANFAFATQPTAAFHQLDSVDNIAAWATRNVFANLDATSFVNNNILRSGSTEIHAQTISGLPADLCEHNLWSVDPSSFASQGTLSITGETPKSISSTQQFPACSLILSFVPDAALFAGAGVGTVDLNYTLQTKIADKALVIKGARVSLQTSPLPVLVPTYVGPIGFGTPTTAPGGFVLSWDLKLVVQQDPANSIPAAPLITPSVAPALSSCSSAPGAIQISPSGVTLDNSGRLSFTLQQFIQISNAPKADATDNVVCTVGMTLRFPTATGPIDRALPPTLIAYPNLTPAPKPQIQETPPLPVVAPPKPPTCANPPCP